MIIPPSRQHPAALLHYIVRYLFLLIIPFIRSAYIHRLPLHITQKLYPYRLDYVALFFLLLLPYASWRSFTYSLSTVAFERQYGWLFRRRILIPRQGITTVTLVRPLYLQLFRAAKLYIETDAGRRNQTELSIVVGRAAILQILQNRVKHNDITACYQARATAILGLALFLSDFINGALFLAGVLYQITRILGEEYAFSIIHTLEATADYIRAIPYTVALIVLLLLIGRSIAIVRTFLHHLPFCVIRRRYILSIRAGVITRRDYICTVDAVHYVDFHQTLLLKALRLTTVFIHCIGYGKARGVLSLLLPVLPIHRAQSITQQLLPEYTETPINVRPASRSLFRYIRAPLAAAAFIYPLIYCVRMSDSLGRFLIEPLLLTLYLPCLWWLIICIIERYTAGLSQNKSCCTLAYAKRWQFHKVILPYNQIALWRVRQTPWQRHRNTGDVYLYSYSDKRCVHKIKNLPLADIIKYFRKGEMICH